MNSLTRNFGKVLLAGSMIFMATSCDDDDDIVDNKQPNNVNKDVTVKQVLEEEEQYSMMNEAVEESNQSSFFANSSANITVFAANNDAFNKLFAEMNVSSMTELKSKMGDEAFANLIMYHAINGKFDVKAIEDGYMETNAKGENSSKLSVYIDNDNNTRLVFNGGDENGATTVNTTTISAKNGAVIEVDAVMMAQTNYENIDESENKGNTALYVQFLAEADADLRNRLDNRTQMTTVMIADEDEIKTMLDINLAAILDVDDLNALIDANAQSSLFTQFNVTTMADLLAKISLSDMLSASAVTMANIYAQMDAQDKAELMSSFVFDGYMNLKEEAKNNATITSRAGVDFTVSSTTSGDIVLTDAKGNKFFLDSYSANSVNGSIYTISKVEKM